MNKNNKSESEEKEQQELIETLEGQIEINKKLKREYDDLTKESK